MKLLLLAFVLLISSASGTEAEVGKPEQLHSISLAEAWDMWQTPYTATQKAVLAGKDPCAGMTATMWGGDPRKPRVKIGDNVEAVLELHYQNYCIFSVIDQGVRKNMLVNMDTCTIPPADGGFTSAKSTVWRDLTKWISNPGYYKVTNIRGGCGAPAGPPHCTDAQAEEPCLCGPHGRITCRKGLYCHGFDNEYSSSCKNHPDYPDCGNSETTKVKENCVCGVQKTTCGTNHYCYDNKCTTKPKPQPVQLPHCTASQAVEPCLCGPHGRITCRKGLYCHGFDNEYKSQCKNHPEEPEYPDCGNSETTKVKENCVCGVQKTTCDTSHYCYDNKCTTKPKPQPVQPAGLPDCGSSFTKKIRKKRCVCGKNKVSCGKNKYCYDDTCNKKKKSVEPVVREFNPNRAEVEVGEEGQLVGGLNMVMYGVFIVISGFLGFYVGQRRLENSSNKYNVLPDGDEVAMVSFQTQTPQ